MKYNPRINSKETVRVVATGAILILALFFFSNILNWFKTPSARAAISFINCGAAVTVGNGNLTSVSIPAGIQNNDILIAVLHSRDNVNSSMPGDWTQKVEGNGNTTNRLEVWWKRTTGTESAPTITHTAGDSSIAKICAFRGVVESGDPFDSVGSVQSNAGTPISTTAITTSTDGAVILHLFGSQDNNNWGSFTGVPTTLAGIVETNSTGTDNSQVLTYGEQTSAGSTGTAGASQTTTGGGGNDAGASVLMALKRNEPPTISISQPDGVSDTIAQDGSYNITYTLSDSDNVVTAAFYYDTNNSGLDGTTISGACATATEGTNSSCTWNTTGVTPGSYYIYGITSDGTTQVSAYSSGTITINARPTLSVSQPDGTSDTIAQDGSYNITYSLADTDNVVTATFYYDTNNSGLDGSTISGACATAVEGTGATCAWNTTSITPGSYYVYGITNDGTNPQVSAYSPGQITINARPSISVSQPDGTSDTVTQGDSYNITYSLSDSDDVITAAFYYDTNNSGLDGTTISGACATAVEGSNVTCSWDTSGASPGIYYVYGIANDGFNSVNAYSSGQITINAPPTPNITVSTTGTQTSSMTVPSTDQYVGGAFTFQRSSGSANITQIIISETGSVNAQTNLSNLKLYYETAGTCSFEGTETLYGTVASFNASQKATITGSMSVGASQVCVYATLNVGSGAGDTQTLEIQITDPSTEVIASAGTVSPSTPVAITGTTTLSVPNESPTLSVSQPDGTSDTIAQDGSYNITYTLSDSDNVVTAAFYYDTNNSGLDGSTISGACATAVEGTGATCAWNTTSITPGSYYVYGITNDGTNPQVSAYSPGQITINARPSISVSQPDGTSDTVTQGDSYNITYSLSDSDDVITAAFYYDTNNSGLDGNTISGACATAVEGSNVTCSWDTSGASPGIYYVYGIANDGFNSVNAYSSGQITINAPPTPNITVSTTGTQTSSMTVPSTDQYVGGAFTFQRSSGSANITQIIISETGSVNAQTNLSNLKLYYETAGTCSFEGTETLYGTASSFNASQKATVTGTMSVGTSQVCVYATINVGSGAGDTQTLEIQITDPYTEVTASAGSVSPSTPVAITGTTTLSVPPNITVSTTGTQTSSMTVPSTDQYVGGAFTFQRSSGSANITQIIISETGSVNAQTNLSNLKLYYETAGTCSFEGTETLYGTVASFNASQKATVTGTMSVGASQVCVYATLNVGSGAGDTQTLEIQITDPYTEVTASAGSVSPSTPVAIAGTTTLSEIPVVTVTSVTPNTGAIGGNTSVTVSGSNFQSGATVTFDGISATNITFVNSNTITAKTPAHAAGTIDVTVTNPDATAGALFNGFTYVGAPTVNLTASPTTIFSGESFVMNWSTTNTDSCNATGAWLGAKATSGSENITPTSSATYGLDCTGVGGSGSDSVYVLVLAPQVIPGASGILFRFEGYSYPGGRVIIYDNSAPFSQLPSDSSGKFSTIFRLTSIIEKHLFSIIAYDKEGNPSPSKTFPSELYLRGGLTDILVAPTITLNKRALNKRENLEVSGYATPNNKVKIEIDSKPAGEITATKTGYYALSISMSSLADGDHRVRALQASSSQVSDYSLLKIFKVAELFVANSDLNNDGKLNISDWSIFLSSWSSRDETMRKKVDLNSDGKINIFDLSIFLSSFRKR